MSSDTKVNLTDTPYRAGTLGIRAKNLALLDEALTDKQDKEVITFIDDEGQEHTLLVSYGRYLLQYLQVVLSMYGEGGAA
jgi:hypothetical protein